MAYPYKGLRELAAEGIASQSDELKMKQVSTHPLTYARMKIVTEYPRIRLAASRIFREQSKVKLRIVKDQLIRLLRNRA
jgi:hypothetical protein